MYQISGQDNISYEIQNHIGIFTSKVVFFVLIGAKGYSRNICFNKGFVCHRNFNNYVLRGGVLEDVLGLENIF